MKTFNLVILLLGLSLVSSGCAHTRLASWKDNERTVCGNRWADENDLIEQAKNACGGQDVKAVGGFQNREVSGISRGMNSFNGASYHMNYKKESCTVFQCGG